MVEEMLELFGIDSALEPDEYASPSHTVMAISCSALEDGVSSQAFQLLATMQGREVLLLVDNGSSTSFIDQKLAHQL